MTRAEIQDGVAQALIAVAPELAPTSLKPDVPLRDQVDLDSMDFLRFVMELRKNFGIDVPESDYQKLGTVSGVVDYVATRTAGGGAARRG